MMASGERRIWQATMAVPVNLVRVGGVLVTHRRCRPAGDETPTRALFRRKPAPGLRWRRSVGAKPGGTDPLSDRWQDGLRLSPGQRLLFYFLLGLLLPQLPLVAAADPISPPPAGFSAEKDAEAYDYCMKLSKVDAKAAQRLAQEWRDHGGAHPADHCGAVALIDMGEYREGAARLETLARAMTRAPASLRAQVLDQAGQAWLLAGDPVRSLAAAGAAVALQPADP